MILGEPKFPYLSISIRGCQVVKSLNHIKSEASEDYISDFQAGMVY